MSASSSGESAFDASEEIEGSGAVSAWASPLARVASRAADALLSISRRSEGGAPAPRAPPSADANAAANAVPVPGDAPVPGDGPYPPMAPSPGTDNPAMNRDVSAMEASAARASGTNEGRDAGGAPAGGAEFDDDALDENRVGVGGREELHHHGRAGVRAQRRHALVEEGRGG